MLCVLIPRSRIRASVLSRTFHHHVMINGWVHHVPVTTPHIVIKPKPSKRRRLEVSERGKETPQDTRPANIIYSRPYARNNLWLKDSEKPRADHITLATIVYGREMGLVQL